MSENQESFHAQDAPKPMGQYPHARKVGDLLFLSGVGPRDPKTNIVPGNTYDHQGEVASYDIEQQCHAVFKNVRQILEQCGASWEQLVDVTVFLTDMKNDFPTYNRIYASYFPENPPCRTTVGITALPSAIAIELKCIANVES
ncbi:MAG: RidA family protein [Cyclobacteriaceae bacterium]|nr:RidA family protein [Cyclobacteriaceae bacterium]